MYADDIRNQKFTSLETIAATITHEIKNPLALIRANIDFIELCDTEKKYIKNYTAMKKEIDRANGLLVDFSRLLQNGVDIDDVISVRDVVEKTIIDYGLYGNVKIISKLDNDKLLIKGSFDLLLMSLSNILKNAVEAINGDGEITVSAKKSAGHIKINVSDNGCGIDSDTLAKLNSNKSVTSKKYGSGLGISLTKRIIAAHGGSFDIRNNKGGGVNVGISIPCL